MKVGTSGGNAQTLVCASQLIVSLQFSLIFSLFIQGRVERTSFFNFLFLIFSLFLILSCFSNLCGLKINQSCLRRSKYYSGCIHRTEKAFRLHRLPNPHDMQGSPYTYTYFWWTKKCRTLNPLIYTCHQGPSGLCGMDGTWANGYISKYMSWFELYSLPHCFFLQIYNL